PTTTLCRVALPLHPTYDYALLGWAASPPDLRPRSVGLRCRSTRPTTRVLSGCAAAPTDLRPRTG
ncbi:MAG TPA: hypothetical protein PKL60_08055, partial [Anaerolineaceae bacterium]|nr:hypothetical protein [Anaerolineaceae bacterium]